MLSVSERSERGNPDSCSAVGLKSVVGSVGDSAFAFAWPSITAREFCRSWVVKSLRVTRKLRAERVGAGGGSRSEKLGLDSERVCVVYSDIRRIDIVDTIEGAGVGCKVNLRVSLQYDHGEGVMSSSLFGDAKSNATDDQAVSWDGYPRGSVLTQDDHSTDRKRNEINQQVGWFSGGSYGQPIQQQKTEGSVHPGVTKQVQLTEPTETLGGNEGNEPDDQIQLCQDERERGSQAGKSEATRTG